MGIYIFGEKKSDAVSNTGSDLWQVKEERSTLQTERRLPVLGKRSGGRERRVDGGGRQ